MNSATSFYRFSGIHSLLIGLLPFFIPVLLWQQGFRLAEISLFIAITGLSFVVALIGWQQLYRRGRWFSILLLSFAAELGLVSLLLAGDNTMLLVVGAILNGIYNCFYWTTQRIMFSDLTGQQAKNQTGKHFGNFQILVVVLLKLGILVGAYLQQHQYVGLLWLLSLVISLLGLIIGLRRCPMPILAKTPTSVEPLPWSQILVFSLDGIFLFVESYFWLLSLFYISGNDIVEFGILVVGLTVLLSAIFMLIKHKIDAINQSYVFYSAVILYAISWALRGQLTPEISGLSLYLQILVIAFLTSFFRLSFNKRFFDHVNQKHTLQLLLLKSYISQGAIAVFFALLGAFYAYNDQSLNSLSLLYWTLVPLGLLYALYRPKNSYLKNNNQIGNSPVENNPAENNKSNASVIRSNSQLLSQLRSQLLSQSDPQLHGSELPSDHAYRNNT